MHTCGYEYLLQNTHYDDVHILHNCSLSEKALAVEWITRAYGVVHDGGHVDAMCDNILQNPTRSSLGVLVQTQHSLDRSWMPYMTTSMADISGLLLANFKVVA